MLKQECKYILIYFLIVIYLVNIFVSHYKHIIKNDKYAQYYKIFIIKTTNVSNVFFYKLTSLLFIQYTNEHSAILILNGSV